MDGHGFLTLRVRTEEDRCSEDPLERRNKTPVMRSALLHPKGIQHFSRATKSNYSVLLTDREGGQKDRNEAILPPWQSLGRMAGYLK